MNQCESYCKSITGITVLQLTALLISFSCFVQCERTLAHRIGRNRWQTIVDENEDRGKVPSTRVWLSERNTHETLRRTIHKPKSVCTTTSIGLMFQTPIRFDGTIAASHRIGVKGCSKTYSQEIGTIRFEMPLMSSECGVVVRRTKYPVETIHYSIRLLVIWGETLSEDDQMFDINCQFSQFENVVGTSYEVSVLPRKSLINEDALPKCHYTVRMQSIDGPIAMVAQIGDTVYHKWECNSEHYKFKVYDCYVHDGQNKKYQLIDKNGCVIDDEILSEPEYDHKTRIIHAKSRVFKFADHDRLFFNCLLYVCPNFDPKCGQQFTKNRCETSTRKSSQVNGNGNNGTVIQSSPSSSKTAPTVPWITSTESIIKRDKRLVPSENHYGSSESNYSNSINDNIDDDNHAGYVQVISSDELGQQMPKQGSFKIFNILWILQLSLCENTTYQNANDLIQMIPKAAYLTSVLSKHYYFDTVFRLLIIIVPVKNCSIFR